jgi:FMN phosphatase YigB (HAD superfamily)
MAREMGIPQEHVQYLTQQLYLAHGTTMAGLAAQGYNIDFDDWHAHVHGRLDYKRLLHSQPATRQALQETCVQPHILTNADAKHTAACLTQMGLTGCFQVGGWLLGG